MSANDEAAARQTVRRRRDRAWLAVVAVVARVAVVLWAAGRFPAVEDGAYYHKLASRLASGAGYTWAWPDGVVTYAAHYPVGYPALVSLGYRAFGSTVGVAMALNALLGVVGVLALAEVVRSSFGRRAGLVAGALLALHPALLFYTPAMMTEGVTASLLSVSVYLALRVRRARDDRRAAIAWLVALGLVVGLATLVRPQSLLVAPLLGALAWTTPRVLRWRGALMRRSCAAALVTVTTLLVCAPWTARNCVRMKSCALVSVNGGWNLLIGVAPSSTGHWTPIDVPDDCKTVWDEAGKDACFGREARRQIALDKLRYLSLVPRKLAATFDYCGAAPWYLHASSSESFPWQHKQRLGGLETVFVRLTLLMALLFAAGSPGPRRWPRRLVALISAPFLFHVHASVAFVGLLAALALGRSPTRASVVVGGALAVVGTTALVHAAFFGAGRYSLVALPFVTALGAAALTLTARARDTV